jgi:hypothetical protein
MRACSTRETVCSPRSRLYATYTLAHGDAHVWNLLYPRADGAPGIYLIDWDAWRIGRGAFDLAYMMALHWYPERRARLEAPLIERYHAGLLAHGVTDYSLDRLWEDYRLAVIGHLATPVWQQSFGLPPPSGGPTCIASSPLLRISTAPRSSRNGEAGLPAEPPSLKLLRLPVSAAICLRILVAPIESMPTSAQHLVGLVLGVLEVLVTGIGRECRRIAPNQWQPIFMSSQLRALGGS